MEVRLDDRQLFIIGGIEPTAPYVLVKTLYFEYSGTARAQGLSFLFSCSAYSGQFVVDNVQLVGFG